MYPKMHLFLDDLEILCRIEDRLFKKSLQRNCTKWHIFTCAFSFILNEVHPNDVDWGCKALLELTLTLMLRKHFIKIYAIVCVKFLLR